MGVMRYSLIAVAMVGALQARHPVILLDQPVERQKLSIKQQIRNYFNQKRTAPKLTFAKPTLAERFQNFKNYFFKPKPQVAVTPVMVQENQLLKELSSEREARDLAFKKFMETGTPGALRQFREKSRIYDAKMYKLFDLDEPERLKEQFYGKSKFW